VTIERQQFAPALTPNECQQAVLDGSFHVVQIGENCNIANCLLAGFYAKRSNWSGRV